jgi:foldase protein PrsA
MVFVLGDGLSFMDVGFPRVDIRRKPVTLAAMKSLFYLLLILCFLPVACSRDQQKMSILRPAPVTQPAESKPQATADASAGIQTVARVGETRLTFNDLQPWLIEAAGGQILREKVLSMQLHKALGKTLITSEQIQQERAQFLNTLHRDPQLAEQLLKQVREREGLGEQRFSDFLFRQAALRQLVQPDVTVTDEAVQQAFERQYGPKSVVQIIMVDNTALAVKVLNLARQGADFGQLVQQFSQDVPSRAANGMLDPISPADPSFPTVMHKSVAKLEVGQISDVVALDNGFAILKLVSKNQRQSVLLDDVKASVVAKVRRDVEQMLMRRLATTLMRQADVVVLDRELNRSWQNSNRNLPLESIEP